MIAKLIIELGDVEGKESDKILAKLYYLYSW